MESLIRNLINGNLTDAKREAKRYSGIAIARCMEDMFGFSSNRATQAAWYLKHPSQASFQTYCDAN